MEKIWNRLFPLHEKDTNKSMSGWSAYFDDCWLVDHLLRQDRSFSITSGGMFCPDLRHTGLHKWRRLYDCGYDETLVTASNVLHSNTSSYLWGNGGRTVFLRQKVGTLVPVPNEILGSIERKLQRAIDEHPNLNRQISMALKHALDFGAGYLAAIDGYYEVVQPMYVGHGITDQERKSFYIIDCGLSYWVLGEKGEMSEKLKVNVSKKYFAIKVVHDKDAESGEKIETVKESNVPMIMVLTFDFYRTRDDIPVGCGMVAAQNVLQLNKLLDKAYYAQGAELQPPVASSALLDGDLNLGAGSINYYDSTKMGASEVAASIMPTRGGNSLAFTEFWRASIRRTYFLDQIVAQGVGQQTAVEAERNAAASSSVFAGMVRPFFNGFIEPLLRNFSEFHFKKKLPENEKPFYNLEEVDYRYIGAFTAVIASGDVSYNNVLGQTIQLLAQIDPNVVALVRAEEVALKVLEDLYPSSFYRSRVEYRQLLESAQQ